MPNILVRDLSEETVGLLKKRAAQSGRSLQQEVHQILERAAELTAHDPVETARKIQERLRKSGYNFPDSTILIREDRDR